MGFHNIQTFLETDKNTFTKLKTMTICMNFIRFNVWTVQLMHHKKIQGPIVKLKTCLQRLQRSHYATGLTRGFGVVTLTSLTQELNSRFFFSSLAGVLPASAQYENLSEQLAYLSSEDLRFAGGLKHYKVT